MKNGKAMNDIELLYYFVYKLSYRPGLDDDGTMFYIEFHCHNNDNTESNSNVIKVKL